jgi:hypothetical protein
MGFRKLGLALAAAVIGGAAAGVVLTTTAHAQASDSISITSATVSDISTNPNDLGGDTAMVTFSVTCPAGDLGEVNATGIEVGVGSGHTDEFSCTGNPQSEWTYVVGSGTEYASGQIIVGGVLDVSGTGAGPYGWVAGTTATVPIQDPNAGLGGTGYSTVLVRHAS